MKSLLHFFLATSVLSIATVADSEPATAPAAPSAGEEQPGETARNDRSYEPGERFVWDMVLSTPDGMELADSKPMDITANADWIPLDYKKDIAPGSALDLSEQGLQDAPATLWASSLDGEPLGRSSRILVTHLTDIQGNGARYADDTRKILLKWGLGCLIEVGAAEVELRLDERAVSPAPSGDSAGRGGAAPTVFALDTAGNRVAEVPAEMRDGALRFRVSTAGPAGGRIYYEILHP